MARVICLTGMPGCGKEELVKVAHERGLAVVRMGDVVREEAARRGLALTDAAVGGMADEERKRHHPGVWAERTLPRVGPGAFLVDGIRAQSEVTLFREGLGDRVTVVSVDASPRTRYERVRLRRRPDDIQSFEAFEVRDRRELVWGLGEVIAGADHHLANEGSLEEFRAASRALLAKLTGA